jgi:hypothetical protein
MSPRDVSGPLLFALSRFRLGILVALLVAIGCWLMLAGRVVPVPLVAGTPSVPLEPLLPAGLAVVLGAVCGEPMPEIEELTGARFRRARALWVAFLMVLGAFLAIGLDAVAGTNATNQAVQSWLSFAGITLLSVRLVGAGLSWVGPVTLLTALLFAGKDQFDDVRDWAWLLRVEETAGAGVGLSVGLAIAGAACYLLRGLDLTSAWRAHARTSQR